MAKVTKDAITAALAKGTNHMGDIVMWALRDAYMKRDELEALFVKHGLSWEMYGPKEISNRNVFRKAQRETKREHSGYLFRPIDDNERQVVLGVVNERAFKKTEDLKYSLELKIYFDKTSETVKTSDSGMAKEDQHIVGLTFKKNFRALADYYTPRDFVKMLAGNVYRKMGALCLRSTGGVYFTLAFQHDDVIKLQSVINDVGQCDFTAISVWDDDATKTDLGRQATRALHEELTDLQTEIDNYKNDPPRRDTMRNRLESFQDMRKRAAMFATMLSVTVDDLETGIGDCEDSLKKLIGIESDRIDGKKKTKAATKKRRDNGYERILRQTEDSDEVEEDEPAEEDEPDVDTAEELEQTKSKPKRKAKTAKKTTAKKAATRKTKAA